MLTLRRTVGASLWIGEEVKVQYISPFSAPYPGIVLGIEAPREIPIRREEVQGFRLSFRDQTDKSIPWGQLWMMSRHVSFRRFIEQGNLYLSEGSRTVGVVVAIEEYRSLVERSERLRELEAESSRRGDVRLPKIIESNEPNQEA